MIHPVILCGGSGTRLWPRSRVSKPKPFLPLVGEQSLFEQTVARSSDRSIFAPPMIVTGSKHRSLIEEQLRGAQDAQIIVEPAPKNTAPAIALAAFHLPGDAVMLICPSDHHIEDSAAFAVAAQSAATLANQGKLVAFGIEASKPEIGYGYIKRGRAVEQGFIVEKFVEKPDLATAEQFLADGSYSWNGGIFAFRAGVFLEELAHHQPDMFAALEQSVQTGRMDDNIFYPGVANFAAIEGDSIDYAVMEPTEHAAMVPVRMGWSDIGNWEALRDARQSGDAANIAPDTCELVDCVNVLIESDGPRVSAIGLEDVIIVVDGDEVLVTTAEGAQKVGKLKGATHQ